MNKNTKIILVGGGKMGSALVSGWIKSGISKGNLLVIEPARENAAQLQKKLGVKVLKDSKAITASFKPDIVVFAVKPQVMGEVAPNYKKFKGAVFLSIAAGKTIGYFEKRLGKDAAIVRAMPNLPATIGRGITAMVANKNASKQQKDACFSVMEAVGKVLWLKQESQLDAVTAVSGSGPAYVFYFLEAIVRAGTELGLDEATARKLACKTFSGAAKLAGNSKDNLADLRKQVTSPGGTTEAALKILMEGDGVGKAIVQAIKAAEKRSAELSD